MYLVTDATLITTKTMQRLPLLHVPSSTFANNNKRISTQRSREMVGIVRMRGETGARLSCRLCLEPGHKRVRHLRQEIGRSRLRDESDDGLIMLCVDGL